MEGCGNDKSTGLPDGDINLNDIRSKVVDGSLRGPPSHLRHNLELSHTVEDITVVNVSFIHNRCDECQKGIVYNAHSVENDVKEFEVQNSSDREQVVILSS